ncbi:MAG: replication-relaxation family protein [Fimbriimonadaceae bacterium]|nr:replication-relaxation family protein [Fimbriimonadaceae bacterium]
MSASRIVRARSRSQRDPSAKGRLTTRDRALVQLVALSGAASRSQIMGLGFFESVSRANRRLRYLFDARYLRRTQLATGANSLETVYVLGPAGVLIAAELAVMERAELQRHAARQPERSYLEHHLGVLSLRLMANRPSGEGPRSFEFLTEPECRHEYHLVRGSKSIRRLIKPDAYFEIGTELDRSHFFLEFDRGNCSLMQMKGVFERYGHYAREGAFGSVYGQGSFEVLVVTTAGKRRIAHLAAIAKGCGADVRFATMQDVCTMGFYSTVWRGDPDEPPKSLLAESTEVTPR